MWTSPPSLERLMPIVVGLPRSGTTLLRMILDAHPQLAIPPETALLPELAECAASGPATPRDAFRVMVGSPTWPDFHISESDMLAHLSALDPFSISAAARCFYRVYAAGITHRARHGTPRSCTPSSAPS